MIEIELSEWALVGTPEGVEPSPPQSPPSESHVGDSGGLPRLFPPPMIEFRVLGARVRVSDSLVKRHTVFAVEAKTPSRKWVVERRYSAFKTFHSRINRAVCGWVAGFPAPFLHALSDQNFIDARQKALDGFLRDVTLLCRVNPRALHEAMSFVAA